MKNQITFSKAIEGYLLNAQARRLSPHTIADYTNTFRKFQAHLDQDLPISQITKDHIRSFLAVQTVSKKTLLNYHTGLSALWSWAFNEGFVIENIVQLVARPKPEKRSITPFSEADIRTMLSNLEISTTYSRPGKRISAHSLPNAERNRAILLLLLDTGIRASELCDLRHKDLDMKNARITVNGKGSKQRILPFSPRTGQAIWRYVAIQISANPNDTLFQTIENQPMDRDRLYKIISKIGNRANIKDCHPHRFRHTFAILYLRNKGDPWSLQRMLGHATMEMVSNYLAIAQADMDASHRSASPVENLRL